MQVHSAAADQAVTETQVETEGINLTDSLLLTASSTWGQDSNC